MIVLVLVLGGWLGWIARSARIQREVLAAIRKAQGSFYYDWQWKDGKWIGDGRPRGTRWLLNILGPDYFAAVTVVLIPRASDTDVIQLGQLEQLQEINVGKGQFQRTDVGLSRIKTLVKLRHLDLNDTQVTDVGLVHLEGFTEIRFLGLKTPKLPTRAWCI